jgi:hypothetical protein
LLRNDSVNTPVAEQWLSSSHVIVASDTRAAVENLLEAVFSVRSVPSLYNEDQPPLLVNLERSREGGAAGCQSVDRPGTAPEPRILTCVTALDRLCGLVARVLGYRFGGPGSIPALPEKRSSGSRTGSTQPREYN